MSSRFQIELDGEIRELELVFGTEHDLSALTRLRAGDTSSDSPLLRDALEFCRLAAKRWRYYRRAGIVARSAAELSRLIRSEPQGEFAMLLLAKPTWAASVPFLGFCYLRRSWCHHLIVNFLAVHPEVLAGACGRVRGIGAGILYQLVELAAALRVGCVWGEATVNSAGFYARMLGDDRIRDHFFIRGRHIALLRKYYRQLCSRSLPSRERGGTMT